MLHVLIAIKIYSAALHLHRKRQVRCHSEFPGLRKKLSAQFHFHLDFTSDGVPKLGSREKNFVFRMYNYISKGHPYQFLAESSSSDDFRPG